MKCGTAGLGVWLGGSTIVAGVEGWRMLAGPAALAGNRMNGDEAWLIRPPVPEEPKEEWGDLRLDISAVNA